MIRKTVVGAMLLMLAGCWGPDGCTFEEFRREFDPSYDQKPKAQPLPQGQPHGPQQPLERIREPLPGGPREPDIIIPAPKGGVSGAGGIASAPQPKSQKRAVGSGPRHDAPPTRLAYAVPRDEPMRREDSAADEVLADYMADDAPAPRRHADPYRPPVYGAPVVRDRDRRPAAYPDPHRRPRYERREPRDPMATPRDRWDRRDRYDRRDRWGRGERMASHDRQALTREQRRADRRAGREDRHPSADPGERRHVNRYDRDRPDRRHANRHDERRDRRVGQQRCDAPLGHHATREERRAARRACRGG